MDDEKRPFFPLFFRNYEKIKYLSMEQRGELLTALFDYAVSGDVPQMEGIVGFAFEIFREDIDSSLERYKETCRKNRENGKKGGRPRKNPTVSEKTERFSEGQNENPKKPNETPKTETEDRSQKQKIEVEDEVEVRSQTDAALTDAEKIKKYFYDRLGREPSWEFLKSAAQTGLQADVVCMAIDKSLHADKPEGYATSILRSWQKNGAPQDIPPSGQQTTMPDDWEDDWRLQFEAMQREEFG